MLQVCKLAQLPQFLKSLLFDVHFIEAFVFGNGEETV